MAAGAEDPTRISQAVALLASDPARAEALAREILSTAPGDPDGVLGRAVRTGAGAAGAGPEPGCHGSAVAGRNAQSRPRRRLADVGRHRAVFRPGRRRSDGL